MTYSWSVQAKGSPYQFTDPGNGDGTIDIDWSKVGAGQWTVQAEVTDSINPPVQAIPKDIDVGNIPPSVGPIQGPTDVSAANTAAKYTVVATDPDLGQTLTYTWSFQPKGLPDSFVIPGSPVDGSMTVDYSKVAPGLYTINVQVSDGFANVNGTAIQITHHNTLPTVGQVTGKTPVKTPDTNEVYSAPYSDPDTTQTLTFKWSVVSAGATENFVLASNPDGSINLDWGPYAVGQYDVNIQANDGIGVSEGTKLVVDKQNTPPVVGAVTGPAMVSSKDTAAAYSTVITDIDPGQTITALWSVVKSGDAPVYNIASLPDKSVKIDWSKYADGAYDVNVQANDGYDKTEGTLLAVTKVDNKPPVVGAVTGPTPVHHSDTASQYSATMSDPDGDPLTVLWSVVPHGNAPNFVIPGAQGTPLTVDWSTYPTLGDYDINVQADDSHNPPVAGTLLKVSLVNTAPMSGRAAVRPM